METIKRKISLRAIEPEDLDMLYHIENDKDLWNVGATNVPYSRYVLRDYIANTASDIYTDRQLRLIIENDGNDIIGIVDLVNFDPRHLRAEIGIVIRKEFRGCGYAKETIQSLLDYVRNILHLHQIYAYSDVCNSVAVRLFQEVGFCKTAVLKDWLTTRDGYADAVLMQYFL